MIRPYQQGGYSEMHEGEEEDAGGDYGLVGFLWEFSTV